MPPPQPPALDPESLIPRTGCALPEPYRSQVLPRSKLGIGDALGLTQFGVNLTTLFPGKVSTLRHAHSREDEFIYVVEGEVTLHTDAGEQRLTRGMCAGFPGGSLDGHRLLNRGSQPARYLEVGSRIPEDSVSFVDDDLLLNRHADGSMSFTRKDGSPR